MTNSLETQTEPRSGFTRIATGAVLLTMTGFGFVIMTKLLKALADEFERT